MDTRKGLHLPLDDTASTNRPLLRRDTIRILDMPVTIMVTATAPQVHRTHHQDIQVLDAILPGPVLRRPLGKPNM
jgi:hypothetical protein